MNWFYESAGKQQGPVPEHELDRLLAEGKITLETLVWREGMADWEPLRIARPSVPPPIPTTGFAGDVPPGHVRCSLTGKVIPESEAIYIQGKPYSAEAKPQVLHSLQSGGILPTSDDAERTGPPWERLQELGVVTAAWETIRSVLMEPSATFSQMRREGGLGRPLSFYILVGTLGMLFFQLCLFVASITGAMQPENPLVGRQPMTATELLVSMVFIPIQICLGTFVQSGITHLSLMICGGARKPFEATFRTLCYAGGATAALFFLPICGWLAAGIWGFVVQCIGLARVHEISTGRAVLAVLLPVIVCCGGFLILIMTGSQAGPGVVLAQ